MRLRRAQISRFLLNDTATTEIYTLSLHDALPISIYETRSSCDIPDNRRRCLRQSSVPQKKTSTASKPRESNKQRSEEHTSELQSRQYLVCRLLLEKKKLDIIISLYYSLLTLHSIL